METPRNPRLKTRFAVPKEQMCNHCETPAPKFKVGQTVKTLNGEVVTIVEPHNEDGKALALMGYFDYVSGDGERDFDHGDDLTAIE